MTHRLYVAALVLGLTTTGALCGDDAGTDTAVRLREGETAETPPGASDADAGESDGGESSAADKPSGGDEGDASQSVGSGGLREHSGELAEGDETLDRTGEYADIYTIDVEEGQTIVVDMRSDDFDPYLILRPPTGEQVDNDDYEGDRTRSHIEHEAEESGAWRVMATSFEPGEEGAYEVSIRTGAGGGPSGRERSSGGSK